MNNKQLVNSIRKGLNLDWNSVTFDGVVFLECIDKMGNKESLGLSYLRFPTFGVGCPGQSLRLTWDRFN